MVYFTFILTKSLPALVTVVCMKFNKYKTTQEQENLIEHGVSFYKFWLINKVLFTNFKFSVC